MEPLTLRQQEILKFIHDWIADEGGAPTRADLARAFDINPNAAHKHLKALARSGAIELIPGVSRGIKLLGFQGLPLVGRVAAGRPILSPEGIQGHYPIDPKLFTPRPDYLLTVQGASMRDVGILDGDWIVVHRTPTAVNGQIVVARVNDEVTVKRFKQTIQRIELHAANPDFAPIVVDPRRQTFAIEGIYVGLIRHGGSGKH